MATTQQKYDTIVNRIVAERQRRTPNTLGQQMQNFESLAALISPQQARTQQPTGSGQPPSLSGPEVLGRNVYNMTGSREAHERYGVPPVLVQSDPYARIAYNVGPGGSVTPMVGYPSVYPHVLNGVVERGMPAYLDQVAAYRNSLLPYMGQLAQIMQPAAPAQRRSGGGGVRVGGGGGSGGGRPAATSRVPNMSPASQQLAGLLPGPDFTGYARELTGLLPGSVREAAPAVQNYNPWEAYMMTGEAPVPAAKPAEQAPIVLDPWVLGEAENDIQGTEEILGRATPQPMDVGPNIDDINQAALAQKVAPLTQLGQADIPQTLYDMTRAAMAAKILPLMQGMSSAVPSPAPVMPPQTQAELPQALAPTPEDMVFNVPVVPSLNNLFRGAALGRMMSGGY